MSASLVQGKQLLELFSSATREEAQSFVEAGDLVKIMLGTDLSRIDRETFRQLMAGSPLVIPPVTIEAQLQKYAEWNEPYGLDLSDAQLGAVDLTPTPDLKPGEVDLVVCYLPDKDGVSGVQRTFEVFSTLTGDEQNRSYGDGEEHFWRWPELRSDPEHLQLIDGYEHRPGLRRAILDRVAYHKPSSGRTVEEVREWAGQAKLTLAGPEVLMDAALDPASAQLMDGDKIPFRDMAAYKATIPGRDAWAHCPYLSRNAGARQVKLNALWVDLSHRKWSAPVLREV